MGHLYKYAEILLLLFLVLLTIYPRVVEHHQVNSMTVHNIALIFGPTLFGANMAMMTNGHGGMNGGPSPGGGASGIGDVGAQNKVSEAFE
jgi:hypothetical protein